MGTRTLTSSIRVTLSMTPVNLLVDGTKAPEVILGDTWTLDMATGVSDDQADRAWSLYDRGLASGANENIDVYDFGTLDIGAGPGNDALGQALTLTEIASIIIRNQGPGDLTVDGTQANGWTPIGNPEPLKPNGILVLHNPADGAMPVTDATNHLLNFAAANGAIVYDVHIAARSL